MNLQLIRAYCTKDLNGKLKPRDKWSSTPESRFEELLLLIDLKHRTGAENLEPRQYAAAVCLRALEVIEIPFQPDDEHPEFTKTDSAEAGRMMLADALQAYTLHLSDSEAVPLLPLLASLNTEPQADTPPAPVVETKEQRQDRRLKACEAAGLKMDSRALQRLPDGVGDVADREGVTRQTFSPDVKAALKRREAVTKPGRIVRFN